LFNARAISYLWASRCATKPDVVKTSNIDPFKAVTVRTHPAKRSRDMASDGEDDSEDDLAKRSAKKRLKGRHAADAREDERLEIARSNVEIARARASDGKAMTGAISAYLRTMGEAKRLEADASVRREAIQYLESNNPAVQEEGRLMLAELHAEQAKRLKK
jgi:hypothetical protein